MGAVLLNEQCGAVTSVLLHILDMLPTKNLNTTSSFRLPVEVGLLQRAHPQQKLLGVLFSSS